MRLLNLYIFFSFFLCSLFLQGNNSVDSLENYILHSEGTDKVDAIIKLGEEYQYTDYTKSLKHAKDALFLSKKIKYPLGIAMAKNNIGYSLTDLGKFNSALDNYKECIAIFKELGEKNREAVAYNDMAYIYQTQGLIKEAIENYIISLKILESTEDLRSKAACLNNIGLLYHDQKNYPKALEYYQKSLETKEDLGDDKSIATSYNNIGSLYFDQDDYVNAQDYFFKSLHLRKKMDDKHGIAQSLTNISAVSKKQKKYTTALEYLQQAEQIQEELNDQIGLANTTNSMGDIYQLNNDLAKAKEYLERSYKLSHKIGSPIQIKNSAVALSNLYRKLGMHDEAYPLLIEHYRMNDTIMNTENTRKLTQIGLQYEFEKKLHENELIQIKKNHDHEIEMKEQKTISYTFAIGLLAFAILAVVIFKSLHDKKKANQRITQQKEEIEVKSLKLEEALENITDSVKYAKRIQDALLQSEEHISDKFPPHFVLYKPKDIVSGDFYWSYEKGDDVYISVVDSTGHGVPGALMSMLGISFLNGINAETESFSPAEILDRLRSKIIEELNQTGKDWSSRDGMDISLAKINLKAKKLEWAGANNPLWIISNDEIKELKANRQAINYNETLQPFTNHTIDLSSGDLLYMFSDGYADQFGGPKGKKFKYNSLKKLILSVANESINKQKEILDTTFEDWKGNLEQIDDVCVIGIKV